MTPTRPVTLIHGDGIGPEVVAAARRILDAAGAAIEWEEAAAGAAVFRQGLATGVPASTIDSILRTRTVLKGPLETPVGYGEKSANVTLRKMFEMYGNVRPVRELPNVRTPFSGRGIDLVVVRENVEDLYAGIEHMQTPNVAQSLKLISRPGCEKIVRLAFELARSEGRRTIHCAHKANILKLTQGLMKRTFEEVAREYPDLEAKTIIMDNCAHQLVRAPEQFEIIVTTNLAGDILSDLTAGLVGGLGVAPAANLGNGVAMFEPVHGSAPDIAGQGIANPTAMILSAVLMLRYIGQVEVAATIENAVLVTLEEGRSLTRDLVGAQGVGTAEFTDAVIANLGRSSAHWHARSHGSYTMPPPASELMATPPTTRRVMGVDVFVEAHSAPEALGQQVEALAEGTPFRLKLVSNRGSKVYPPMGGLTECLDLWRCRFVLRDGNAEVDDAQIFDLVARVAAQYRWMHLEKLQEFDGAAAYTKAQGEA